MKATDLRIGNYVQVDRDYLLISGVKKDKVFFNDTEWGIENIHPIELTEVWLDNFGWDRNEDGRFEWLHQLEAYDIEVGTCHYLMGCGNGIMPIKFVHQLQNLCFALTGKELTTKN